MSDIRSSELGEFIENLRDDSPLPPFFTVGQLKALIASKVEEARESAKQEFRDKFMIDPTKKYHVVGTEKAIIITEWEHHKALQSKEGAK